MQNFVTSSIHLDTPLEVCTIVNANVVNDIIFLKTCKKLNRVVFLGTFNVGGSIICEKPGCDLLVEAVGVVNVNGVIGFNNTTIRSITKDRCTVPYEQYKDNYELVNDAR